MSTLSKLLRRTTAAALCAIAALTVPGVATAQTVSLSSGASCVYSSMTVNPNGNVAVQCGASTSPGTLAVVAPTSLPTGSTTMTGVGVSRSGGSVGAAGVNFALTGTSGCVSSAAAVSGSLSWNDLDSTTQAIPIVTGATTGTCIVTISAATGASLGSPTARTINIVDPNAPATFAFAAPSSSTTINGGTAVLTINRGGGTNGDYTANLTLGGTLAPTGALVATGGSISAGFVTIPAGQSSANVTYTAGASPGTLTVTLGDPAGPTAGSTAIAPKVHTVTVNNSSCAAPSANDTTLGWGETPTMLLASGAVGSYLAPLTSASRMFSGKLKVSSTTNSPSDSYLGTFLVEVQISKCKGVITVPAAGQTDYCYYSGTNRAQPIQDRPFWVFKAGMTDAQITTVGACATPTTQGPWYINIRYTYGAGACAANCGYKVTPYPWNY
jgi:hypothetical protein